MGSFSWATLYNRAVTKLVSKVISHECKLNGCVRVGLWPGRHISYHLQVVFYPGSVSPPTGTRSAILESAKTIYIITYIIYNASTCRCLERIVRTSLQNLKPSRNGSNLRSQVSDRSLSQVGTAIALSEI